MNKVWSVEIYDFEIAHYTLFTNRKDAEEYMINLILEDSDPEEEYTREDVRRMCQNWNWNINAKGLREVEIH